MDEINILLTLKFGSEKNIMDLYKNGTIYCNTIEYFRTLEDQLLRGDNFEGTTSIKNFTKGILTLTFEDGKELKLNINRLLYREHLTDIKGNLYCLTVLRKEDLEVNKVFKFDVRNQKFGTHFLLIKDNKTFYERLSKGFEEQKLKTERNIVSYYDKNTKDGKVSPFEKP